MAWALAFLLPVGGQAQEQLSRQRADVLFKKGEELINHTNYGASRKVFDEFLEVADALDSRRSEAEYYRAYAALQLSHTDGEKLIQHFIDKYPSHPRSVTAYYELANFFYAAANYTKAISCYGRVNFNALPAAQQEEGKFRWGYGLFSQKKLPEALEKFTTVKISSGPYAPAASYYSGFIEFSSGDYETALIDLKRAEGHASYAAVVPVMIANALYKSGRYDELITYHQSLQSRAATVNNYGEISMLAADAYFYKNDYAKAAAAYEQFLGDSPEKGQPAMLYRAGFSYFALKQNIRATELLKLAAAANDSVGHYASYYLGILYLAQGNKPYAFNSFDHARKWLADKALVEESTFQFAKVAYETGKPDVAITELERFLVGFPSSTHAEETRELLAQAYANGNNFNKAIEHIEGLKTRSEPINRAYQKAAYLKASEFFNKEEYANALVYFEKSLASPVDPNYVALAALWGGEALSLLKRYSESVSHYQQSLLVKNAEAEVLVRARYGLGYAYFNQKQYAQALPHFKEFVVQGGRLTSLYSDGVLRLADCYYVTKAYADAVATYNKARQLNSPDDDYILFQTGVIMGIQKRYAEARTQFNVLISSYPKSSYRDEALFQRAQFEIEQGNYAAAVDGFSQLISAGTAARLMPYAFMRRAASNYNLKQYDKTIADYLHVLHQYPTHPAAQQVLLPLQEALGLTGRSAEFDAYLAGFKKANPDNKNLEVIEFETAKNLYFDQQYSRAISLLGVFVSAYPQSSRKPEAVFYLAESYYRQKEYAQALPLYDSLLSDPSFTQTNRVIARAAEIEFKLMRLNEAVARYRTLERMAANKKELYTAWSGLMESFFLLAQYDSVKTYASHIIEKGNINAGAVNKASLFLGKSAMAQGDFETAEDEFLSTFNSVRDEYGAEAKYRLAEIFFTTKQYKMCYETLISLNTDFAAYEEWVGRSYLMIADYYVVMNDIRQAKATLESLSTFPLKHIQETAGTKLRQLMAEEEKTRKQIETDTLDQPR